MSLKRRDITAWILLLAAAVVWTYGRQILQDVRDGTDTEIITTVYKDETYKDKTYEDKTYEDMTYEEQTASDGVFDANPAGTGGSDEKEERGRQIPGLVLCLTAVFLAGAAVFGLRQRNPLLGPDGVCAFSAVYSWIYCANCELIAPAYAPAFTACLIFFVLLSARELWGWIRIRFGLGWCMLRRLAESCPESGPLLLFSVSWIAAALSGAMFMLLRCRVYPVALACLVAAGAFGFTCLWVYGADLSHVKRQLDNYRKGLPITVRDGAFAETEAQLLEIQAQHEEAVRTAVTSERFKVELISNVSHDLRTPLTSILGYSELLQKEELSPEGRRQLCRLYQKAGYMNDLVESLFELTKVSSGVIESKKEEIDLVRLLEQTLGLFDDQLTNAGLIVRRHYVSESVMLITDGARMHQVFANLLGNAIKYALAGTRIYLEVKEDAQRWLVRMTNTSSYEMDFEPEEIMQRFARGDKARSTRGSGLGLAIARTYTESVGGSFRVAVDGDQFSAIVELPKAERNL